jgi:hypothetical protein
MKTLAAFVVCLGITFLITLGPLRGLFVPTQAATDAPSGVAEWKPFPETLAPACAGAGVEEAAKYLRGNGPHRIAVLSESGKQHEWHDRLPEDWRATETEQTVLVLVVGEERQSEPAPVKGPDGQESLIARRERPVRVVAARTGQVIAQARLTGDPAEGADGAPSRSVSWEEQVVAWLRPLQAPPPPFPSALEAVRRGVGVPQAAPFVRCPGPHPLTVLRENGGLHPWHTRGQVGAEWLAANVPDTELVVLVGEQRQTVLSRHQFVNGPDVLRVQYDLDVRVVEARTGVQLGSRRFQSPVPRPVRVMERYHLTRLGSPVSASAVINWVRQLAEGR